jgi:hypothetical protein
MRAIIALKSDADVRKERWQFQICDLVYGGRCGRHFASSHRAWEFCLYSFCCSSSVASVVASVDACDFAHGVRKVQDRPTISPKLSA